MFRRVVVAGAAAVALVLSAGPAWAHVTVNPSQATRGGFGVLTFRVPNEDPTTDTTQLAVTFPEATPLPSVSVQPVPGWTATVTKTKLAIPVTTDDGTVTEAVTKIVWSGGTIKPGEFQEFPISVGPFPDTDALVFKAVQTSQNGSTVNWVETAAPGGAEPEHPAPTVTLVSAHASTTAASDDSSTSKGMAITGIVLGGLALIVAVVALVRRAPYPRTPSS